VTVTAEQIRADVRRFDQPKRPYARRKHRPTPPPPTGQQQPAKPWLLHPFDPDREQRVPNQCLRCWGWYDDPRHLT
jgi:hypothetical protein